MDSGHFVGYTNWRYVCYCTYLYVNLNRIMSVSAIYLHVYCDIVAIIKRKKNRERMLHCIQTSNHKKLSISIVNMWTILVQCSMYQ